MKVWELIAELEKCEAGAIVNVGLFYNSNEKGLEGKDLVRRENASILRNEKQGVVLYGTLSNQLTIGGLSRPSS